MLGMEHPECIGNGVYIKHALLASCFLQLGEASIDLIAIDHAINDHVAHVESAGAKFPRHPLGDGSKSHKRVESLPRKAASQSSPQPLLGPHTHNHRNLALLIRSRGFDSPPNPMRASLPRSVLPP
jgi:hypothetical protein